MNKDINLLKEKYNALSLLTQFFLIINRDKSKLLFEPPIVFLAAAGDTNNPNLIKNLFRQLLNTPFYSDNLFTPTNETPEKYVNNVINYYNLTLKEKIDKSIYSEYVFTRWLIDVYSENGIDMPTDLILSENFQYVLGKKNLNVITDIITALEIYKAGKINRNIFKAHFLDPVMGLLVYIFNENSKCAPSYCLIGNMLLENGLKKEALSFFEKAIIIEEDYVTGYIGIADLQRYSNNYEKAIDFYLKAISLLDKFKREDKTSYFLEVCDLKSQYTECYYSLSICFSNLKQFDNAIKYIDNALESDDSTFIGHKIDKYESLGSVKEYVLALLEKSKEDEFDYTKSIELPTNIKEIFNSLYENNYLSVYYKNWNRLTEDSRKILKNINFLETVCNSVELNEYSLLTTQYFKIIEIELYNRILKKLEAWLVQESKYSLQLRSDIYSNKKFKKVSLASYRYIFSDSAVLYFLEGEYPNYLKFLSMELLNIFDEILEVHNGAKHRSLTNKEKHLLIKSRIIDNKILDVLCEF